MTTRNLTLLFDIVCVAAKVTTVSVAAGNVITVLPLVRSERAFDAENVMTSPPPIVIVFVARAVESLAVRVFPSAMVNVEPVAGAVRATLFIVVALATPNEGVTREGEVERTTVEPEPVVVAAINAVPFPAKTAELIEVVRVMAGVVVAVATVPVNPFAETTDTDVTVPLAVFVMVVVPPDVDTDIPVPAAII